MRFAWILARPRDPLAPELLRQVCMYSEPLGQRWDLAPSRHIIWSIGNLKGLFQSFCIRTKPHLRFDARFGCQWAFATSLHWQFSSGQRGILQLIFCLLDVGSRRVSGLPLTAFFRSTTLLLNIVPLFFAATSDGCSPFLRGQGSLEAA